MSNTERVGHSPESRIASAGRCLAQRFILAATILGASLGCAVPQSPDAAPKDESFRRVVASIQQKDFVRALTLSESALHADPKDYRIWTLRGMAYSGLQKQAQAQIVFEHALKLAPYYLPALEGEAQLNYRRGDDSARPFLSRILTLRPNDPTSHAMLAVLDYRKKNYSDAITHFEQASESISSQPDLLSMFGKCLANASRFEEAIPVFEKALALDSTKRGIRFDLALCQWTAGRSPDALATLLPLVTTDQSDERILELAAAVYESTGETQHAIELLRRAILANPKQPDAYLQFAELTYEHGSPQIGIDILNAGLTQLPKEASLYLVRGVLLCQFGEFTKAFDDFQVANRLDPRLSYVDVAKGIVASQVHKPEEALAEFRVAAKEHPNEAFTQYLLAEALSQQEKSDVAEVIKAASRAVQLDPSLVAAQDLMAGIYLQQGEKQQAIAHSEEALAVDPKDQQALYHLVLALRQTDRKAEIPGLMKRLNALKQAEGAANAPQKRLHLLLEEPETKQHQ